MIVHSVSIAAFRISTILSQFIWIYKENHNCLISYIFWGFLLLCFTLSSINSFLSYMNTSFSERKSNFLPRNLKLSHILAISQIGWTNTYLKLKWIKQSSLAIYLAVSWVLGFVWQSSKWAYPLNHICQYTPGIEHLAHIINTDFN